MSMTGRIAVYQDVDGKSVLVWSRDDVGIHEGTKVNTATNIMHYNTSPANIKIVLDILVPEKTDDGT